MSDTGIEAILVRRNRAAGVIAIVASVVAPAVYFGSSYLGRFEFHQALVTLFAVQTAIMTGVSWFAFVSPRREPVTVKAEGTTLHVGAARVPHVRSGVATAMMNGRYRVDLGSFPRPRTRLEVPSAEDARAILAALGLDRRAGTTRFDARWATGLSIAQTLFAMIPVLFVASILATSMSQLVLLIPLFVPLGVWLLSRTEVTVGTDGVHARSLGRKRFVAHADIENVVRRPTGLTVVTRSGKALALDTSRSREQVGLHVPDPIYDAILGAWKRSRSTPSVIPNTAVLAKGTRSTRDWIDALREIGHQRGSGYRVAPIDENELFDVVGDALAPTELRAAAAVTLAANPEHGPKLRIAADDVADPIVRRVVLAATQTEDLELEDELDHALAGESPKKSAKTA